MKWEKKGLIHFPRKSFFWNQCYSMVPVPFFIEDQDIIRVYFATTDKDNFGRTTFIDLNADDPSDILYEHDKYIIGLGDDGTFDDSGVLPSCIIKKNDEFLLYTIGFQRTVKTPYMLFAGLTVSKDLLNFQRFSKSPILPRNKFKFISQAAPCVISDDNKYKMWYWYATKWIKINGKLFMDYHIGYAESNNAIDWDMRKKHCLKPDSSLGEFAVARPWVFKKGGIYHMYYSTRYKNRLYRITYATSKDGLNWERQSEKPFDVGESGWDSSMTCYSSVINVKNKTYMFYNGNNNGATGFGYAELINE